MRALTHLREWSGVLALILVLAGGTAYAANEWTGTNIIDESLTGADVKGSSAVDGTLTGLDLRANSLRGDDIAEASLGRVPDSAKLAGLPPTSFAQGGSAVAGVFGASKPRMYFNRATAVAGSTSTVLRIPGRLHLSFVCSASSAKVELISDVDGLDAFARREDGTGGYFVLDTGQVVQVIADDPGEVPRLEVNVGTGADTFGAQRLTAISVDVIQTGGDGCFVQAFAIDQQT